MNRTFLLLLLFAAGILTIISCKKTGTITDHNASVYASADTLHFDTVFTTTGSVTQFVKIFNNNDQNLVLSNVQLMGGKSSYFSMNVDGLAGTTFSNIEIAPNDSVYIFVKVSVDSNNKQRPFIVQDSIQYSFNGNTRWIQLDAYGRNAIYLRNKVITQDTTFSDSLPVVILGGLYILPSKTLTIAAGTQIYAHADAAIQVYGTLKANGDSTKRISFQCDRLDDPYSKYPGSWPGIYFLDQSDNSVLNFTNIKNAYQGVIVNNPSLSNGTKLTLNQCIIDNISAEGILASNTSVTVVSSLISNCGTNVSIVSGGTYLFNQCTIVSYDNDYISHKIPVVNVSNNDGTNTYLLKCIFNNSIIYGQGGLVDNEIGVNQMKGNAGFILNFDNVFYKLKKPLNNANVLFDTSTEFGFHTPAFVSLDFSNHLYDFHLQDSSVCLSVPANQNYLSNYDLSGNVWGTPQSIGCYNH